MTNLGTKWLCFCPHRSVIELLLSFESKKLSPPLQSIAARNKRFLFYWGQRRRNTKTMSNLTSSSYYLFFVLCPMLSLFSNSWPFTPLALSSFPLYPHISRSDKREEEWMRERERIREREMRAKSCTIDVLPNRCCYCVMSAICIVWPRIEP